MYFDLRALKTDWIRNCNLSKITLFSGDIFGETAKTASLLKITSTSFKLFLNKVLPLETISTIASAKPMLGAISTEPEIWCKSTVTFFELKKSKTVLG